MSFDHKLDRISGLVVKRQIDNSGVAVLIPHFSLTHHSNVTKKNTVFPMRCQTMVPFEGAIYWACQRTTCEGVSLDFGHSVLNYPLKCDWVIRLYRQSVLKIIKHISSNYTLQTVQLTLGISTFLWYGLGCGGNIF